MKRLVLIVSLMFAGFAFVACDQGTVDPPSVQDLEDEGEIVNFRLPDGRILQCFYYGTNGKSGYSGYSWLILDCDWESLHQ